MSGVDVQAYGAAAVLTPYSCRESVVQLLTRLRKVGAHTRPLSQNDRSLYIWELIKYNIYIYNRID